MPAPRKRPCSICRQWFRPNSRVGPRQHACSKSECQTPRRKKTQANWRAKNPEYAAGYRLQQRGAPAKDQSRAHLIDPRLTSPVAAKDQFQTAPLLIVTPGNSRMQLEFHQLERRWEYLRVRHPQTAAEVVSLAGRIGTADTHRGGGRRSAGPLPGH
jgi:hypothetical protein